MAAQPDAMESNYTPDTDLMLFATPQIPYGGKVKMEFTTPAKPAGIRSSAPSPATGG